MEPAKEPITSTTRRDWCRCWSTAFRGAVGSATKNSIALGLCDRPRKTSMVALRSARRSANVELRNINTIGSLWRRPGRQSGTIEKSKLILFYRWKPGCDLKDYISAHALD